MTGESAVEDLGSKSEHHVAIADPKLAARMARQREKERLEEEEKEVKEVKPAVVTPPPQRTFLQRLGSICCGN